MSVTAAPSPAGRADAEAWVFDADGHVVEPDRVWSEYLLARFRDFAPRVDGTWPHSKAVADQLLAGYSDELVGKIIRDNASRMLGLSR